MPARRRLTPDQRRAEILDAAEPLFAAVPYDDVDMDAVADRAGVSRALLYRYFPGKRELFAAVYRRDTRRLAEAAPPASSAASLQAWIADRLDAHIDYVLAHPHTAVAASRVLVDDPVVREIADDEFGALRETFLDAAGLHGPHRDVVAAVLSGWSEFVRVLSADWLRDRAAPDRPRFHAVCLQTLLGALSSVMDVSTLAGDA